MTITPALPPRPLSGSTARGVREKVIKALLAGCAVVSIATTFGIIASLVFETVDFFSEVSPIEFFTGTDWAPTFTPPGFGVVPLLSATLLIACIGALVAAPIGLGTAIYLSEYAKRRVRKVVKPILEILAGIPTIVFGYFALRFLTPEVLQPLIPGTETFNALAAGLVIGVMIIPQVASISEDSMRAVPRSLREAAFAVGSTRRRVATRIVFPAALSGIAAALILGLSRAVGETMIVAVAASATPNLSIDPREPMGTMTAYIVQISLGDTPTGSIGFKTIFALGSTLFAMTLGLNILSHRIARRFRERYE